MDLVQPIQNEEEIWKPLVRNRIVLPGYFVSNLGRIRGKKGNILKLVNEIPTGKYAKGARQSVKLSVPHDLFQFTKKRYKKGKICAITLSVHRAVIETFKSIDDNPPIPKSDWEQTPESAKKIIRDSCVVDHIDNNPMNNNINNLRWVTLLENQTYIKRQLLIQENNGEKNVEKG